MAPTTRRQSGKLPPPRNPVLSASPEDEDDFMDGALSDLEEPLETATSQEAAVRKAAKADVHEDSEDLEAGEENEEGLEDDEEYNASGTSSFLRKTVLQWLDGLLNHTELCPSALQVKDLRSAGKSNLRRPRSRARQRRQQRPLLRLRRRSQPAPKLIAVNFAGIGGSCGTC